MKAGLTRQQKRRIGRESIHNPQYMNYSGVSRFARRHMGEEKSDVVNQRKGTKGRDVRYQCIYDVLDTRGKKILSFGNKGPLIVKVLPRKIYEKVAKKCFNKKTLEWKRRVDKIVLVKTIKHIVPSANVIKLQKLIMSTIKLK